MTRVALVKLFILVILAFIICLPEFFYLHRVSKVNFACLCYRRCARGSKVKTGEKEKIGNATAKREDLCGPAQTAEQGRWEQACTQWNQNHGTDSDSRRGGDDSDKSWFMCQTDMDMAEIHSNISSSAVKVHLEVSVELQLSDAETVSLTLFGQSNYGSLDLQPPEDLEENGSRGDEGQKAFFCCLPVLPISESANQSRCLLWLSNQTRSNATAKEKLPWKRTEKEWWCIFKVLCLALLCVLLLTVVTTVLGKIYMRKRPSKKPMMPNDYNYSGREINDGEKDREPFNPRVLHFHRLKSSLELSPIEEARSQEDIETLLDGKVNHCYPANLHHRGHPSVSCLPEEQQEERSMEMVFK